MCEKNFPLCKGFKREFNPLSEGQFHAVPGETEIKIEAQNNYNTVLEKLNWRQGN